MTDASEWRGAVGDVWAREWRRTDRAFAGIGAALDAALLAHAPPGPFAALDIGSGAGATALSLATARPDAEVNGVELSAGLVAVARERLRSLPDAGSATRVTFRVGDAVALAAALGPFDLLMSRHGVMFFADPVAAFAGLRTAAQPRARLIFSCFRGRDANPWAGGAVEAVTQAPHAPATDAPGPFAFAEPIRVAAILAAAGWRDATAQPVDTIFRVGVGPDPVADAVDFFSRIGAAAPLLRTLPPNALPAARERLAAFAAAHRAGDAIDFPAAAWIWTATA